ncbi:MAG: O-antigen ligase family protein [Firmicutes bacterium]|nr:O-antigen ligase family protein [Bacillota bacterium]
MEAIIQEKLNCKRLLRRAEKFIGSEYALAPLALAVIFFHTFGFDLAGFTFLAAYLLFVFFSKAPIRACLPPLLFLLYIVSLHNGVSSLVPNELDGAFFFRNAWYLGSLGAVVIAAAVYGMYKRKLKFRVTYGLIGVSIMGASMVVGGFFSENYTVLNLAGGLSFAAYFIVFFIFCAFIAPQVSFDYIAKTVIVSTLIILYQLTARFLNLGIFQGGSLPKNSVSLGWGISNSIAPMIAIGLPFTAYYMAVCKRPWFHFIVFCLQMLAIIFCLSRAMIIFAIPAAVALLVWALLRSRGRERKQLVAAAAVTALLGGVILTVFWQQFSGYINFYITAGTSDRGRNVLFSEAIEAFLQYPFFGAGVAYRLGQMNVGIYLVHNTVLQFMLWSGVFGLLGLLAHLVFAGMTAFRKPNEQRIFLLIPAALIFLHSILDIVWFMPTTTLYYMLFLAKAESDCIQKTGFGLTKG